MQQSATPNASIQLRLQGDMSTVAELQVAFLTVAKELGELGLPTKLCFISDEDFHTDPGKVDGFIGISSNATWARSRHRSALGPAAVRAAQWPWGFPWLGDRQREEVESANSQLREILIEFNLCHLNSPNARALYFHLEDFGRVEKGIPASPWQLPELRKWSNKLGLLRLASYQCEIAALQNDFALQHRLPIGLLTNAPLGLHPWKQGWPMHHTNRYFGPLPNHCACGQTHQAASSKASKHPQDKISDRTALLQWCARVITREQLLHKETPDGQGGQGQGLCNAARMRHRE